jgi:YaiO family outer membrane protein
MMKKVSQAHIRLKKPAQFTLLFFFFLFSSGLFSQLSAQVDNVDEAFSRAQELAFDGKRAEARELCRAILEVAPDYHDVRILIARTYSWDGNYTEARKELLIVLENNPSYKDAHLALIDNEIWAEDYDRALQAAETAQSLYPNDVPVLLKVALANKEAGSQREAVTALNRIDQISPGNREAFLLRQQLQISALKHTVSAAYTHDWFTDIFKPGHKAFLQLERKTKYGPLIGRLNIAHRYEFTGLQPEIDFYPAINGNWYGYLNVGLTDNRLYPVYRFGAEIYRLLPLESEASLGFRVLRFKTDNVFIYTGSISKYYDQYFFTVRPFFIPRDDGVSASVNLIVRRYLTTSDHYASLLGGFGFSPEERRILGQDGEVAFLKSAYIGLNYYRPVRTDLIVFAELRAEQQELRDIPGASIGVYTFTLGMQFRF